MSARIDPALLAELKQRVAEDREGKVTAATIIALLEREAENPEPPAPPGSGQRARR